MGAPAWLRCAPRERFLNIVANLKSVIAGIFKITMSRQLPRALRAGQSYDSSPPDPPTPSEDASYSSGDDVAPGESQSVINGIERTLPLRQPRASTGGEIVAQSPSDRGVLKEKNSVWDDLANKMLPPEGTEYIIQQLEKRADKRLQRTYVEGLAMAEVDESAITLNVGLTFLPGADKPMVNRIEQTNMAGKEPDQKDANWRVNTAGSLLRQFEVSADLQIVQSDQTSSIVKTARSRIKRDSRFQDQAKALSLRKSPYDAVTIDSECVKIVNDLRSGLWDVQGLLVEVDGSSLLNLMMNYRHLISRGGPDMTFQETRMLLETMIEDARRLCVRSPILFRMSTRAQIINSKNTRYGIDHGPMFRTLTTSKGIQEIISLSASYYNSLDPTGSDDNTQSFIKPKFLQMIVLLLSLLNDNDLKEIQEFLESTYKLKADRRSTPNSFSAKRSVQSNEGLRLLVSVQSHYIAY